MKPTLRDYLSIAAALLAIFFCGYGIGFLLGERKATLRLQAPPPAREGGVTDWESQTLATLQKSIELSPDQLARVKEEIARSAEKVREAREDALQSYRSELGALHQRLKPHLSPEQWQKLQAPPQQGPPSAPED